MLRNLLRQNRFRKFRRIRLRQRSLRDSRRRRRLRIRGSRVLQVRVLLRKGLPDKVRNIFYRRLTFFTTFAYVIYWNIATMPDYKSGDTK